MSNQKNVTSNAHLQALLDLQEAGFGELSIDNAIKMLTINENETEDEQQYTMEILRGLQDIWNRHQYPDTAIKLLLLAIYDLSPDIHSCSLESQALFFLMIRIQQEGTGYVAVKKKVFGQALGFSRNKIESKMSGYLQELEDINVIQAIFIPPKGSDKPCIYKISDKVSKIGKGFKPERIGKKLKYKRVHDDVAINADTIYRCGTLDEITANEKKGSATNTARKRTGAKTKTRLSKASIPQPPDFTQDPEIPFNDNLPGQIDFSDLPGVIPEESEA